MSGSVAAKAAYDMLAASAEVTDLYRGDCRGCGECCSRFLPVTPKDEVRLKWHLAAHPVTLAEPKAAIDLTCPLLSDAGECMAYDARPAMCRAYRCDLHARGAMLPSPELHGARVVDMRELLS